MSLTVLPGCDELLIHIHMPHNLLGVYVCHALRQYIIPGNRYQQARRNHADANNALDNTRRFENDVQCKVRIRTLTAS
jgi:hypothetical protein